MNPSCKKEAQQLKSEYLLAGGSLDRRLDVFIAASLDNSTTEKVTADLEHILQTAPGKAYKLLEDILESTCAQDIYERGVLKTGIMKFAICIFS